MKLYLMRHGQASNAPNDDDRALSAAGKKETAKIAQFLRESVNPIGQILHSPKKRAQETALIVRDILGPEIPMRADHRVCPNDDPAEFFPALADLREDTLIVSHLPFIPRFVSHLVSGADQQNLIMMPTAAIVILDGAYHSTWSIAGLISPDLI